MSLDSFLYTNQQNSSCFLHIFRKSFSGNDIIVKPPPTSRPITESPIEEIEEPQTTTQRKEEEMEVDITETTSTTTTEGPVPEIKMRKIIKVSDSHQSPNIAVIH